MTVTLSLTITEGYTLLLFFPFWPLLTGILKLNFRFNCRSSLSLSFQHTIILRPPSLTPFSPFRPYFFLCFNGFWSCIISKSFLEIQNRNKLITKHVSNLLIYTDNPNTKCRTGHNILGYKVNTHFNLKYPNHSKDNNECFKSFDISL